MGARFLVLEGVDGSGKSTQAERLLAWLGQAGPTPAHLREPGTTDLGERVRGLLLDPGREAASPEAEALLFFAARRELLVQRVIPALRRGQDVLCERFTPSTLAYQGHDPATRSFILALDALVVGERQPDLVLILDLPIEESLRRMQQREAGALDGMENRGAAFLEQVRAGYHAYAEARPDVAVLLDVMGKTPTEVEAMVQAAIEARCPGDS